ncbi:MAG TPA: ABC transporter permease [Bryobacteraceae bacterium]|nr:ABC transporter permease [Bryobacteraceae bacterium]
MSTLLADLRFAFRMLVKRPGFTSVAVLALALGIGANTAVFSVLRGVVLRPLPYNDPDRLVAIWESNPKSTVLREPSSPPNLKDWIDRNQCFTAMAGYTANSSPLTDSSEAEMLNTGHVTANYFELLGVRPALGRAMVASDQDNEVALLSAELWDRRFGRDPNILGRQLRLGGVLRTVIGVMPPGFRDIDYIHRPSAELWLPLHSRDLDPDRRDDFLRVTARMKHGVTVAQARAEMTRVGDGLQKQYPGFNAAWTTEVHPLAEAVSGDVSRALWLLLASAAVLLLIACANVANLALARSTERRREFAIRAALGGGAARLFRQLITESLVLGLLGGAAGFLLGEWTRRAMLALGSAYIPRAQEVRLDSWVMLFALAASCVTAVLFGALPARQASRADLNDALKSASRGATSSRRRTRSALVVAEVALSLVLVVAAGLLLRSFWQLESVDLGFDRTRLLTAALRLPPAQPAPFLSDLIARIEHLPGVIGAAAVSGAPLTGAGHNAFVVEGRPALANDVVQDATLEAVTPGYFQTMGIPLRSGRYITSADSAGATKVFVVNETFVRRFFPNEDPLGHRISFGGTTPRTIVGVVADVHESSVTNAPFPQVYVPHPQWPFQRMALVVRASLDPLSLVSAVRAELRAMDPSRPLYDVHTEDELAAASIAPRRFALTLVGLFAGLALLVASIGIYGVISYTVTESTKEFGIRMALGALKSDVLRMVLGRGLRLVMIGIAVGAIAALGATRVMGSFLFNVSATDPVTFVAVACLLIIVAIAACLIPARRATRVDPMVALRYE